MMPFWAPAMPGASRWLDLACSGDLFGFGSPVSPPIITCGKTGWEARLDAPVGSGV